MWLYVGPLLTTPSISSHHFGDERHQPLPGSRVSISTPAIANRNKNEQANATANNLVRPDMPAAPKAILKRNWMIKTCGRGRATVFDEVTATKQAREITAARCHPFPFKVS